MIADVAWKSKSRGTTSSVDVALMAMSLVHDDRRNERKTMVRSC